MDNPEYMRQSAAAIPEEFRVPHFFESPAGKKYVETQPAFLTEVVTAMQGWQGKISTDMMTRVRAEMKKKGHEL